VGFPLPPIYFDTKLSGFISAGPDVFWLAAELSRSMLN
jgi:hypothetical protein